MRTTSGQAKLIDGYVVITFGVLDDANNLSTITLDVDPYAIVLARDLIAAIAEQGPE